MLRQKKLFVVLVAFLSAPLSNAAYAVPVFEISSGAKNSFVLVSGAALDVKPSRAKPSDSTSATAIKTASMSRQPVANAKIKDVERVHASTSFASLTSPAASYISPAGSISAGVEQHVSSVSASPIGKNWLALGIGMALIAYQLRRKIKSYGTTLSIG